MEHILKFSNFAYLLTDKLHLLVIISTVSHTLI